MLSSGLGVLTQLNLLRSQNTLLCEHGYAYFIGKKTEAQTDEHIESISHG